MSAVARVLGSGSSSQGEAHIFTFVVDGEEIQIETRYLLPCDYFNNMLSHGMSETTTRRVSIDYASKETVQAFLSFLKTYQLPNLNTDRLLELYALVHQYQHQALLTQVRALVIRAVLPPLTPFLTTAVTYEDSELKTACKDYVNRNAYTMGGLIDQLVDAEEYSLVEEILTWPQQTISRMITVQSPSTKSPLSKLLFSKQFDLAVKLLDVASSMNIRPSQCVANLQEAILQLLDQSTAPTPVQQQLIETLSRDNPAIFTQSGSQTEDPPIVVAMTKGWSETFEMMLKSNRLPSIRWTNSKGVTLLSLAIAQHKLWAIEAMKKGGYTMPTSEFAKYVLEAIKIKNRATLEAILTFPLTESYGTPTVTLECVTAAMATQDLAILKAIWPYFKGNPQEIATLRQKTFDENRWDLAEIMFSGDFDASKEISPDKHGSWLHYVAIKGSLEWIEFMLVRSSQKNGLVAYQYKGVSVPIQLTPLMLVLRGKRPKEFALKMLELGCDINIGNGSTYPLHLAWAYEDGPFLLALQKYRPNKKVVNQNKDTIAHLLFSGKTFPFTVEGFSTFLSDAPDEIFSMPNAKGDTPLHLCFRQLSKSSAQKSEFEQLPIALILLVAFPKLLSGENADKKTPLEELPGPLFTIVLNQIIKMLAEAKGSTGSHEREILALRILLWCGQRHLYHFCHQLLPLAGDLKTLPNELAAVLLHLAVTGGAIKATELLVEKGIPVDCVDNKGNTALHLAVGQRVGIAMVRKLLDLDADPTRCNLARQTPLSIAMETYPLPRSAEGQQIIDALEQKTCIVQ